MKQLRQSKRRWCRRIGWAGVVVAGLPLVAFLVVQLLLATPWPRAYLASKISKRFGGLETEIAGLGWTPWGGATLEGLSIGQPEPLAGTVAGPLLEVERIHVWPDYREALRGKPGAKEVTVTRPELLVTIEMLVAMATAGTGSEEPPPVVAVLEQPAEQAPEAAEQDAGATEVPEVAVAEPEVSEPEKKVVVPEPVVVRDRIRVVVTDARCEVVRAANGMRLGVVEDVDLDLPLFGEPAASGGSIGRVESLGQVLDEKVAFEIWSKEDQVAILRTEIPDKANQLAGTATLRMVPGLPVNADLSVIRGHLSETELPGGLSVSGGRLRARFQGGGWIQLPSSVRGIGAFEMEKVSGRFMAHRMEFDSARGSVQVGGGMFRVPDVRLLGDGAALLGNGWMRGGGGAAVLRVVVPYETVALLGREFSQHMDGGVFAFRPLEPGNRFYSDVSVWRESEVWTVRFGEGGAEVSGDALFGGE